MIGEAIGGGTDELPLLSRVMCVRLAVCDVSLILVSYKPSGAPKAWKASRQRDGLHTNWFCPST